MKSSPPNDYMKYWRIVRKLVKEKYGVGTEQLDFLFFLYSEEYFTLENLLNTKNFSSGTVLVFME